MNKYTFAGDEKTVYVEENRLVVRDLRGVSKKKVMRYALKAGSPSSLEFTPSPTSTKLQRRRLLGSHSHRRKEPTLTLVTEAHGWLFSCFRWKEITMNNLSFTSKEAVDEAISNAVGLPLKTFRTGSSECYKDVLVNKFIARAVLKPSFNLSILHLSAAM